MSQFPDPSGFREADSDRSPSCRRACNSAPFRGPDVTSGESDIHQLVRDRRAHLHRLASSGGAAGELFMRSAGKNWIPRPRGKQMDALMNALERSATPIARTSFDFIELPLKCDLDLASETSWFQWLPQLVFVELKTSNQSRVTADFEGFFFSLTEKEIAAFELLRERHVVVLYNAVTGVELRTSVPALVARARSATWQLSVQL